MGRRLVAAVRAGEVPEKLIDDKVRRVLLLAARVGVLDGVPPGGGRLPPADLDGDAVAHEVAARSFVLARNERLHAAAGSGRADQGRGDRRARDRRPGARRRQRAGHPAARDLTAGRSRPRAVRCRRRATRSAPTRGRSCPPLPQSGPDGRAARRRATRSPWTRRPCAGSATCPAASTRSRSPGWSCGPLFTPVEDGEHTFAVSGFGTFDLTVGGQHLYVGTLHPAGTGRADLLLAPREHRAIVALTAGVPVEVVLRQTIQPGHGPHGLRDAGPPAARRPDADGHDRRGGRAGRRVRTSRWSSWAPPSRSSPRASTARHSRCRAGRTSWWYGWQRRIRARSWW